MTTKDLIEILDNLGALIDNENELNKLIEVLRPEVNLTSPNQLILLGDKVKELDLSKIFFEINTLKNSLEELALKLNSDSISHLLKIFQDFEDTLQQYLKSVTPQNMANFIVTAKSLTYTRLIILEFIKLVSNSLIERKEILENEKELTLYFYNTYTYDDVLTKLKNIDEVYSEICFLFDVSKSEYPLRIVKVETGSLLVIIIGNLVVIGFIIWLFKEAIKYVHRNYTLEGQIESIPKKIDAAEKALKFSKKLEESGVDISTIKDDLGKSMLKIISPLNELVSNQAKIKINEEEISIGDEYEQKFLKESEQRLIGDGNQSDESNIITEPSEEK